MIGTSTRNGLNAAHAIFRDSRGITAQNKAGGSGGEFRKTSDRKILMVESGVVQ